jgi:TP901 family phage tail tape measure protein
MQVLLKDGSGSLDKLTSSLKNSDGAAAKMANTMQGNAKGAIEQMKGALETAAIKIQQLLAPIITQISQKVSELVSQFSALSPATQKNHFNHSGLGSSNCASSKGDSRNGGRNKKVNQYCSKHTGDN